MSPSPIKSSSGPFERNVCTSHSPHSATVSAGFSQPEVVGLLFPALKPRVGEPGVGPGPLTPPGVEGALQAVVGLGCFMPRPLLPASRRHLLYVTGCMTSVPPDLRQSPVMVVLSFHYNMGVVTRGGMHNIYLLCHIGSSLPCIYIRQLNLSRDDVNRRF